MLAYLAKLRQTHIVLEQGLATYGLRARSGLPSKIVQPASPLRIVVTVYSP